MYAKYFVGSEQAAVNLVHELNDHKPLAYGVGNDMSYPYYRYIGMGALVYRPDGIEGRAIRVEWQ